MQSARGHKREISILSLELLLWMLLLQEGTGMQIPMYIYELYSQSNNSSGESSSWSWTYDCNHHHCSRSLCTLLVAHLIVTGSNGMTIPTPSPSTAAAPLLASTMLEDTQCCCFCYRGRNFCLWGRCNQLNVHIIYGLKVFSSGADNLFNKLYCFECPMVG